MSPTSLFNRSKPYEQIPFQISLHIQDAPWDTPKHIGFLAEGNDDPRLDLLTRLKNNSATHGSIVTYNAAFEKRKFNGAAEAYPQFKEWDAEIQVWIVDLLIPFQSFRYYQYK